MDEIADAGNGEERFSVVVPSPLGLLQIVTTTETVVGLYHENHDPPPAPRLLGRRAGAGSAPGLRRVDRARDDPAHRNGPGEGDHGEDHGHGDGPHHVGPYDGEDRHGTATREQPSDPDEGPIDVPASAAELLDRVAVQLEEYFEGSRTAFDLPSMPVGTVFQRRVWSALAEIPYGERRSYGEIATVLGNPRMGRAIGAAVRANPISIIIPGHRVVSRSGGVIGYAAGAAAKEAMLRLEAGPTPHSNHNGLGGE